MQRPYRIVVSVVVAYYPYTKTWLKNMGSFVKRFQVPVLVMAAKLDRYQDCCVVESMQAMEAAAKQNGKQFELWYTPRRTMHSICKRAKGEPAGSFLGRFVTPCLGLLRCLKSTIHWGSGLFNSWLQDLSPGVMFCEYTSRDFS